MTAAHLQDPPGGQDTIRTEYTMPVDVGKPQSTVIMVSLISHLRVALERREHVDGHDPQLVAVDAVVIDALALRRTATLTHLQPISISH
jgi:hypothetical protein